jgi:peroxiredoxin (alkyl hydroperoxide reductase subunit C)
LRVNLPVWGIITSILEEEGGNMLENPAPNFCAPAYAGGVEKQICLNEYTGKWLLLLFYSSDFSFV